MTDLINLIIENWYITVIVLAVFASLCLGVFKGAKHGIRAMTVLLVVLIVLFASLIIYYFIEKDLDGLIKFGIAWLPTIIFLVIVILSTLVGIHRGLRKSLILLLHAVIIGGSCIGAFFFCVSSPQVDKGLLDLVNVFMGEGGLQNQLGVSSSCETMREVLLEYVNGFTVDMGEFGILLQSNSAYVLTLINMAYRLAFAIVFYLVYLLLSLIMYIIYLFCYPERKYRRKRDIRFAKNEVDCAYHKRPVGGGCVGLARGLVSGIISLSFVGSIFFIAVGGTGASKLPEDISFGENYDPYVSIYRSIENYGEQGIFKVLNAIRDPEDTPYYLFAADLVFSGGLDDEEHGVSGNIKFRKELAAYTGFAKNTLALLLKYDTEGNIKAIMRGEVEDGKQAMDRILNVCQQPEFRVEFNNLIDNFDSQTYVINFALSLADAVVANIDDMSFMSSVSADNKELLQIMFKRGYLSETIPDERDRKHLVSNEEQEIPPHLTINHLLTKKDAQIVLDIILSIVSNEINTEDPATIARVLIPYIEDLSILSTERSKEMDPVLGRLYCYFDNKYLTEEGEDGITYAEVKDESVFWTKEIRALMGVSDGIFTMYDKVQGEADGMLDRVLSLFDETTEGYEENVRTYEELTSVMSDSKLISKVLGSKKISRILKEQLSEFGDVYLPENIRYANEYDKDGNLISHGEAYQLLRGLRLLADKQNREIIDMVRADGVSYQDVLKKVSSTITRDDPYAPGNSLASYLTESVLLRSAISSVMIENSGETLIVPTLSLETNENSEAINLINKFELRQIMEALPELCDMLLSLASEEVKAEDIKNILDSAAFNSLLDNGNKIVEGTISKAVIDMLADNDRVIISKKLENYEEWITVGTAGELRKLLYTIDALALDIEKLIEGEGLDGGAIFEKLKSLDNDSVGRLLDSGVFYYTASKMMDEGDFAFEGFEVIVPSSSCQALTDDKLDRVIKKDELTAVFIDLKDFGLSSDISNENIIRKLVEQKAVLNRSNIISASVVNFIVTHEDICNALSVPQTYIDAGRKDKLYSFDGNNIWRYELPNMIGALDEIFGISQMGEDEEFIFNAETISQKTNELLKSLNNLSVSRPESKLTRLDVCYSSDILKNNITTELDSALEGVVDADVIASAKSGGYYTLQELRALSETAQIFDIDILEIDSNELASKVKKEIITLNKPRPGDGRTTLDIMEPSAIIKYFVTDSIDKALNGDAQDDETLIDIPVRDSFKTGKFYPKSEISALVDALEALGIDDIDSVISTDSFTSVSRYRDNIDTICTSGIVTGIITKKIDSALTEDVIEVKVKRQIKGNKQAYSKEEISALIDALDELGMTEFSDFEGVDFTEKLNSLNSPGSKDEQKTKLDIIYASDIVAGVFTKSVKDTFAESGGRLVYHDSANRSDLSVLRKQEIDALITLLNGNILDDLDVGSISLESVRTQLAPDSVGAPRSYLVSANFTLSLIENKSLYVPSGVYKNRLINAEESVRFIDALMALQGGQSMDDWTVEDDMVLPDRESREMILKSEIMRATFSHHVFTNENNTDIILSHANMDVSGYRVTQYSETASRIAVISAYQLNALFDLIESLGGQELEIPSFDSLEAIKGLSGNLDALYAFDVTRYNMSGVIMNDALLSQYIPESYVYSDNCYKFNVSGGVVSWTDTKVEALTRDGIQNIIDGQL